MSTLATTDPKELRPLLRERIEHATDAELEAVRKALLKLEAERAFAEMAAGAQADHLAGKHDPVPLTPPRDPSPRGDSR